MASTMDVTRSSLYERLGGAPAIRAVVDDFYGRVLEDSSLTRYFEGVELAQLKGHQAAFLTAALGGPKKYQGQAMYEAHAALKIDDAAFDKVAGHLNASLAELGVNPELTREVMAAVAALRPDIVAPRK